jgi:hypothetical protein
MKLLHTLPILLYVLCATAQSVERKIIIQQNKFYYTTIDAELQVATLHTGTINDTTPVISHLALPAGRNYREPLIPFCWDLTPKHLYAVNFIDHPMSDRNESLKRVTLSSLRQWDSTISAKQMLMTSATENMFTYFQPYQFTQKRSKDLQHFFFDAIAVNDTSYYVAMANKGELSLWHYDGKDWKHSAVFPFKLDKHFSIFEHKKKIYMLQQNGHIYELSLTKTPKLVKVKTSAPLTDGYLVINKDTHSVQYIKEKQLNWKQPAALIFKKTIPIF